MNTTTIKSELTSEMNGIKSAARRVQTTFAELCEYMGNGNLSMVTAHNGKQYVGRITGIQLEDGSGKNWNVRLIAAGIIMDMYTRFE